MVRTNPRQGVITTVRGAKRPGIQIAKADWT